MGRNIFYRYAINVIVGLKLKALRHGMEIWSLYINLQAIYYNNTNTLNYENDIDDQYASSINSNCDFCTRLKC